MRRSWSWRWRNWLTRDTDVLTVRIPISRQLMTEGDRETVSQIVQAMAGESARTAVLQRIAELKGLV